MSLTGKNIYELPKGNIITDPSHYDIIHSYDPIYTENEIQTFDTLTENECNDYFKKKYIRGFIGLNKIGKTDFINVLIQCIGHCSEVRNKLLNKTMIDQLENQFKYPEFVKKMSLIIRKQWNNQALKALITPFELTSELQRIKKTFSIDKQGDVIEAYEMVEIKR